jgi:hypothetical protein
MIIRENTSEPPKGTVIKGAISEKIADLQKRGYKIMFTREATCLYCIELNRWITTDSFTVDECYHFEDASNPDRDRLLYAISSTHGFKGFLIDASFVYKDNISKEMARKLIFDYSLAGQE